MPGFVRSKKDEKKWSRAKKAVSESRNISEDSFSDRDWALANKIYHTLHKTLEGAVDLSVDGIEELKNALKKARRKLSDEYDPFADEGEGEYDDLTTLEPDEIDDADKWLQENAPEVKHDEDGDYEYDYEDDNEEDQEDEDGSDEDLEEEPKATEDDEADQQDEEDVEQPNSEDEGAQTKTNDEEPKAATEASQNEDVAPTQDQEEDLELEEDEAPSTTGAKRKSKFPDLDPARHAEVKDLARHWLHNAEQVQRQQADAKKNPHLFAEGHRIAAHNTAHEDFHAAATKFMDSDEYKKMSPVQRMRAELKFKKDWHEKNPSYLHDASNKMNEAHKMHDAAKQVHSQEKEAQIKHVLSGGHSGGETFSAQEAAQHVGGEKDDEGYSANIISDPAARFAHKNQQFIDTMRQHIEQASGDKPASEAQELSNPDMKVIAHSSLSSPKNKAVLDKFFSDYHPLIGITANRVKKLAAGSGIPEAQIDMGALHEAGMHGLMQAAHDYNPHVGAKFTTHAAKKMQGLMQGKLASQDVVPKELRDKQKMFEAKQATPPPAPPKAQPISEQAPSQPTPPPAPKVPAKDLVEKHPAASDIKDRMQRVDSMKNIIVRKKTGE